MKIGYRPSHLLAVLLWLAMPAVSNLSLTQTFAQSAPAKAIPAAASAPTPVPALMPYVGVLTSSDGKPRSGEEVLVTFLLFTQQSGGDPLWAESQTVALDAAGRYQVQLGAVSPSGLPAAAFASGETRWLEVQVAGGTPQPRVLLGSVPYAMKAADAATLGGLPASAFMLAGAKASASQAAVISPDVSALSVTTPGGAAGYLPVYSGVSTVDDSVVFESTNKIGIGTNIPQATLDVNGNVAARGPLTMESNGTAAAASGKDSQQLQLAASVFSSASNAVASPVFALQAEPSGNDTTAPTGTLNLLFGQGAYPLETGLSISSKGLIKFAAGQTFPGSGTLTGVSTTSPLTGSGTTGSVAIGLNLTALETTLNAKYPQLAVASKFTAPVTFAVPVTFASTQTFPGAGKGTITGVTTTAPLTGSASAGTVALGLNLPALETTLSAKYAQLAVANKFTAATTFASAVTFSSPITFAATQTFPGIPGGGTITGITTTSPLAGTGTKGSVALSLNMTALETTLNASYARLGAANIFTQPITFASTQKFPGTITGVTAGTGLTGGGTTGAITLALDPKAIPTLTGSPVFTSSTDAVQGITSGGVLNTAGVQGEAGSPSGVSTGIAGVWGDAYSHVGVLGTSYQYSGVQGISATSYGVQGSSNSNTAVLGTSNSGTGVSGLSTTNSGVAGYTPGTTINTAGVNGKAGALSGITQIVAGVWGDSYQQVGVEGTSNQSVGVYGGSVNGPGIQGASTNGNAGKFASAGTNATVYAVNTAGSGGSAFNGSSSGAGGLGIYALASGAGATGLAAYAVGGVGAGGAPSNGVLGYSSSGSGVYGDSTGTVLETAGVLGVAGGRTGVNGIAGVWGDAVAHVGVIGSSSQYSGVYGFSSSSFGVQASSAANSGLFGVSVSSSNESSRLMGGSKWTGGVWGDTGSAVTDQKAVAGVIGTADNNRAAIFWNNSAVSGTVLAYNQGGGDTSGVVNNTFEAASPSGMCGFGGNGDMTCTGQVKTLANTEGGTRTVETYSMQSPENWMEDFGSGNLHNGVAIITIDPAFAETASNTAGYHVFLTPNGDSKGLYVFAKTATSFGVRESGGGQSTISFDYRIVAKRRGFETQRLTDVTEKFKAERSKIELRTKPGTTISSEIRPE
jgi:hypothetical protein